MAVPIPNTEKNALPIKDLRMPMYVGECSITQKPSLLTLWVGFIFQGLF